MKMRLRVGSEVIEYELERKAVKNLNMRIRPTGEVRVSASPRVPQALIDRFVADRADFIRAARERVAARAEGVAPPTDYSDGAECTLIGRRLTISSVSGKSGAYIDGDTLILSIAGKDTREVRERLYLRLAGELLCRAAESALERFYPSFAPLGIARPTLRYRSMRSRWGSCHTQKGVITLSYMLITKPQYLIDYVVMHELCHLIHADHSPAFHREMSLRMPDWQSRRRALRG